MKTRQATQYALLGVLRGGARHGYEIRQYIENHLGSTWHVSTSQLYALLKRLEDRGWLRSSVKLQQARPSKRVFSLTRQGKNVFDQWVCSPTVHVRDLRVEFLVKLFFIRTLKLDGGSSLLKSQVHVLEAMRKKLSAMQEQLDDGFQKLVLDSRITIVESWLNWLDKKALNFLAAP